MTVGTNNIANGPQSAAIGNSLQNYQPNNLTVGQYNTPVTGDLFTVGNGSGQYDPVTGNTNRSNALSVTTDGVNIPGTAEINSIPAQGGIANFTGTAPAWWSTGLYNIFSTQTQGGSDSSPANIGQLKHVTSRAKAYFDTRFSAAGGAALPGDINTMLTEHIDRDAPVAVGQLKYVAQTFYDRLIQRGYSVAYPWSSGPGDPGNAAPATIGQIKQAFSFDLGFSNTDTDGDGLTDWAEYDGAGNPSKFDLPKLTLQYAWREANGKDSITGQGSGTLRKVKGVATGDGSREWEMQQPPPPGQEVSALFALYSIINSPAEFPFSGWESWPGLVNARFDQALVGDAASTLFPMPVTSHTYHRREIKVRLHADRPMPVTWKVHLSQMLTQKIGPTLTQSFEPEVVVLEIPMGGQEAIYTLFPGSAHPGQPNTQFPNREAFLDYQLVTTGTSGPVVFDGPAKDCNRLSNRYNILRADFRS